MAVAAPDSGATAAPTDGRGADRKHEGVAVAAGLIGAIAASSCCVVPLALFAVGVSGAWIGSLARLAPYQPIFVAVAVGFLGYGYYLVYWKSKRSCAEGVVCPRTFSRRVVKAGMWLAALLVGSAVGFPYYAPILLGT